MNTAEHVLDFPLSPHARALARWSHVPGGVRQVLSRVCGRYCERLVNQALGIEPNAPRSGVDVRFCDLH